MTLFIKSLVLLLIVATAVVAKGKGGNFGVGVIVGNPTSLSGKYWLDNSKAIDGALGWNLGHGGMIHGHADYLIHVEDLIPVKSGSLPLFYGPGVFLGIGNDPYIGIRFPVGLAYYFANHPIGVFIELAPSFTLVKATGFGVGGGVGGRYYF